MKISIAKKVLVFNSLFLIFLVGCSENEYATVSVTGQVLLDEEPVANANIIFEPIAPKGEIIAGPQSFGKTDQDGRYSLRNQFKQEGAIPGKHRVRITNATGKAGPDGEMIVDAGTIPMCYDLETVLTFEVQQGGPQVADFKLKSTGE